MPNRAELPPFFVHRAGAYSVMPDVSPMTWSIWDLESCIGDISVADGVWSALHNRQTTRIGSFDTWQESIVGLLDSRPLDQTYGTIDGPHEGC